jgi:hypothetical protein
MAAKVAGDARNDDSTGVLEVERFEQAFEHYFAFIGC